MPNAAQRRRMHQLMGDINRLDRLASQALADADAASRAGDERAAQGHIRRANNMLAQQASCQAEFDSLARQPDT